MKILFVTPIDPLEDWHGGAVRSHFLWESLKQLGDVHTTVVCRKKGYDAENKIKYVGSFNGIKSSLAVTKLALLSIVCPWMNWAFYDREYILEKLGWSGEHFDKVVVRLPQFMATNRFFFFEVAYWKIAPLYVDIDDLPSEDFNTTKRSLLTPRRGRLYYWLNIIWQSFLYRRSVGAWVANRFQKIWVSPFCRCAYLPNIVNVQSEVGVREKIKGRILVIGFMGHPPNVYGIDWFQREIWPDVFARFGSFTFAIVGSKLTDDMRDRWSKVQGVEVVGYVKDIADAYHDADIVVVPILTGGGTCVKTIEALSFGKKVMSTRFGVRGFSEEDCDEAGIDVFDDANSFIAALSSYCDLDGWQRRQLGERAREFVRTKYSKAYFDSQVGKLMHA